MADGKDLLKSVETTKPFNLSAQKLELLFCQYAGLSAHHLKHPQKPCIFVNKSLTINSDR
jgi:hypothetical protein